MLPQHHDSSFEHESIPTSWGGTTDPRFHDPKKFRYLVHALRPYGNPPQALASLYVGLDEIEYSQQFGNQKINLIEQPEQVANRVSLSMSLIDENHTRTFHDAGLIITAPPENIMVTSGVDAGTQNSSISDLQARKAASPILDGDSLLAATGDFNYNEVVALANIGDSKLQLSGFFYKTVCGRPKDETLTEVITGHANRLGLSVVEISEPSPYSKDEFINDNTTAIHLNGRRYLISQGDAYRFIVFNESQKDYFISPEELEYVLHVSIDRSFIDDKQAETIRQAYAEHDKDRQTPKVFFDDNGEIDNIRYFTGYGESEVRISIDKHGEAKKENLAKEKNYGVLTLSGSQGSHNMSMFDFTEFLSWEESEQIIHRAIAPLNEQLRQKVLNWSESVTSEVKRNYIWYRRHKDDRSPTSNLLGSISLKKIISQKLW